MYYIAWNSLPFKRLGSETIVLEKKNYVFIQQLYSTLIKNDIKGIYNARKYNKKKDWTAQLFSDNNQKCFRLISEGSCDTEHWRNEAENSALPSQEYISLQKIFK